MIKASMWPVAVALAVAALPAAAQSPAVDSARAAGAIGERYDGYLGIAGDIAPMIRSQVGTINIKRRSLYSNLGARKGASPQAVGITAGCQLLAGVPVGGTYMWSDGKWRRRLAGQPAPVPDYCR